jgi:hypothetical protein
MNARGMPIDEAHHDAAQLDAWRSRAARRSSHTQLQQLNQEQSMEIVPAITTFLSLAALLWAALMLCRHGLAGMLRIVRVQMLALAAGIGVGLAKYRRSKTADRSPHSHDRDLKFEALKATSDGHHTTAPARVNRLGGVR